MSDSKLELLITSRERDLGGFSVRRLLPLATHRMVGPFIFFDHLGPAEFAPGHGMDVRPHPHINLATVTYLFEGRIHHQDSVGSDQVIEPGAINWMTAGRGIVHSERTTDQDRKQGMKINGLQIWVALPAEHEERAPSFSHHPKESLPEFEHQCVRLKLLLGEAFGHKSPVPTLSPMFYIEAHMPKGTSLTLPSNGQESAVYMVSGHAQIESQMLPSFTMAVAKPGQDLKIDALEDSRVMFFGGEPVGPRFIFWNLVSSSQERIEAAKQEWRTGPRLSSQRFQPIPGDQGEFIPLPVEPSEAKPSPL